MTLPWVSKVQGSRYVSQVMLSWCKKALRWKNQVEEGLASFSFSKRRQGQKKINDSRATLSSATTGYAMSTKGTSGS